MTRRRPWRRSRRSSTASAASTGRLGRCPPRARVAVRAGHRPVEVVGEDAGVRVAAAAPGRQVLVGGVDVDPIEQHQFGGDHGSLSSQASPRSGNAFRFSGAGSRSKSPWRPLRSAGAGHVRWAAHGEIRGVYAVVGRHFVHSFADRAPSWPTRRVGAWGAGGVAAGVRRGRGHRRSDPPCGRCPAPGVRPGYATTPPPVMR